VNLCLFDLDHTLLPIDSDHAWGEFVIGLGWVDAAAFRRGNDAFYALYREGRLDIDAYVEFATKPLRARSAGELARTWKAWSVGSEREVGQPALVAHSALVYGVSAAGLLTDVYPSSFEASEIAHDVPKLALR